MPLTIAPEDRHAQRREPLDRLGRLVQPADALEQRQDDPVHVPGDEQGVRDRQDRAGVDSTKSNWSWQWANTCDSRSGVRIWGISGVQNPAGRTDSPATDVSWITSATVAPAEGLAQPAGGRHPEPDVGVRVPHVGVDQERPLAGRRDADGQLDGQRRLPLPADRAGDEHDPVLGQPLAVQDHGPGAGDGLGQAVAVGPVGGHLPAGDRGPRPGHGPDDRSPRPWVIASVDSTRRSRTSTSPTRTRTAANPPTAARRPSSSCGGSRPPARSSPAPSAGPGPGRPARSSGT